MKTEKTTFCAHFWPFLHIFMQARIFLENLLLSIFSFIDVDCCEKFQKRNTEQTQENIGYRHTDRQIDGSPDKHVFIGPPLPRV